MSNTLLLADESVTMQRVVELTFAEQGLKIASVSDGQQAIDYITAYRPALALINVTLPKVNGFDVARFVRDHAESRLPVLLLAGAFDNLDERTVRESGAAGVLVKPFEPAVVIKRVKELLGMKGDAARPEGARALSDSGRLVTSADAPGRDESSGPRPAAEPAKTDGPWHRLRQETGLGHEAAPVEGQSREYLDQLDAAFESLDAQLAGRAAPPSRTSPPPAPTLPAALDPAKKPVGPVAVPDFNTPRAVEEPITANPAPLASEIAAKPVFEVDNGWFAKKADAAEPIASLTEFVVTRASDFTPVQSQTPAHDDQSWIPSGAKTAAPDHEPPAATEPAPPSATSAPAPVATSPADEIATFATPPRTPSINEPPATTPMAAADAFAMLWAQEQGEAVAAPPATSPADLSDSSLDLLAAKISDRVAELVTERLLQSAFGDDLRRTVNQVAERIVRAEIERISAAVKSTRAS